MACRKIQGHAPQSSQNLPRPDISWVCYLCARVAAETLEFLVLLEEHAEADYGSVDEQATSDAHDHGAEVNELRVRKDGRESYILGRYNWSATNSTDKRSSSGWRIAMKRLAQAMVLTNSHYHKEACDEAAEVEDGISRALDKVVWVGDAATDPVRHGRNHVGRDDEQRVVDLPQGA